MVLPKHIFGLIEKHCGRAIKRPADCEFVALDIETVTGDPLLFEEDQDGYLQISKGDGTIFRRQDAPKVYEYNGAIYIMNAETLKTTHMHKMQKRVKYLMDDRSSFDLDTMFDWTMAEMMAAQHISG